MRTNNANNGRKDFVTLADRNRTSHTIFEYMNLNVSPCEDFFEFACGKWIENRSAEGKGDIITPQIELELGVLKDLEAILSNTQRLKQYEQQKVYNFYQSCCAELPNSPSQEAAMKELKDNFGYKTGYDWLYAVAALRAQYGLNVLISFNVDMNEETFSGNTIYIGEPQTTIIPSEYCNAATSESMNVHDGVLQKLIEEVSRNMQKWNKMREHDAKLFAMNIIAFELELCKKMRMEEILEEKDFSENENEIMQISRRMPISQIGQSRLRGNKKTGLYLSDWQRFLPEINLNQYVKLVVNAQYPNRIFVRDKEYLKNLAIHAKLTSSVIVANYILYRIYAEINFPVSDHIPEHQDQCARWVKKFFPKISGELFQRRFMRQDYRMDLDTFFNDIKRAFETSLESEWISENTRRVGMQKLSKFKASFVDYRNIDLNGLEFHQPDFWRKLLLIMKFRARKDLERLTTTDPDERSNTIDAHDVDAKLIAIDDKILVGLPLFREPFYEVYYPQAMKYASLAFRLARELVFAFDEEGWRPTPQNQRQWDEVTEEGYRNQSDCFREQYSNYLYNNPDEFRNSTKLREIKADSSGLNLAFNAYLSWLESVDPRDRATLYKETLPNLNFTNTQLFFIHFAQTRCVAKPSESPPPAFLPAKKHTPQRYDVNGPLSNFIEFAREFGCTAGDDMHPADKCVIY